MTACIFFPSMITPSTVKHGFHSQCSGPCHTYRSCLTLTQNTNTHWRVCRLSLLQASPPVIEIQDSTNECEEEVRSGLVQMEEKAFVSNLHSFMKEKGSPIERIPHLGFKQSEFKLILFTLTPLLRGVRMAIIRPVWFFFHFQLIFGRSTKLSRNVGVMI